MRSFVFLVIIVLISMGSFDIGSYAHSSDLTFGILELSFAVMLLVLWVAHEFHKP